MTKRQPIEAEESQFLRDLKNVGGTKQLDTSFRRVFEAYYSRVYSFFRKRTRDVEECRDLTQETFLRVLKGEAAFDARAAFEGWLFAIAANVHRNNMRTLKAKKRDVPEDSFELLTEQMVSDLADLAQLGGSQPKGPLEIYLQHERMSQLARALRELPDQMRRCVVLRLHHGLKYREIAELLKISIETVKAHLYQARRRLRVELASSSYDVGDSQLPEEVT